MQRKTSWGTPEVLDVSMDDGVDVDDDLDEADMGKIFGKGSIGSFKLRFVDARCCTSVFDRDSTMLFGIEVGT